MCFNRYMVECKSRCKLVLPKSEDGFNRYMVECKSNAIHSRRIRKLVLIDTWWNVNPLLMHFHRLCASF